MNYKNLKNDSRKLEPVVMDIKVHDGARYKDCKVVVTLEVSHFVDGKKERKEMMVEYPIQDKRHLSMLMRTRNPDGDMVDINHFDKFPIARAIEEVINAK